MNTNTKHSSAGLRWHGHSVEQKGGSEGYDGTESSMVSAECHRSENPQQQRQLSCNVHIDHSTHLEQYEQVGDDFDTQRRRPASISQMMRQTVTATNKESIVCKSLRTGNVVIHHPSLPSIPAASSESCLSLTREALRMDEGFQKRCSKSDVILVHISSDKCSTRQTKSASNLASSRMLNLPDGVSVQNSSCGTSTDMECAEGETPSRKWGVPNTWKAKPTRSRSRNVDAATTSIIARSLSEQSSPACSSSAIEIQPDNVLISGENIEMDSRVSGGGSVTTRFTHHSTDTIPISNFCTRSNQDETQTILTTSTISTQKVLNSAAAKQRRIATAKARLQHGAKKVSSGRHKWQLLSLVGPPTGESARLEPPQSQRIPSEEDGLHLAPVRLEPTRRRCESCKVVTTHREEKYGVFGMFCRMKPLTTKGRVYKGFCLSCHDVYELRQLLNDTSIPLSLIRHDPNMNSSLHLLQDMSNDSPTDGLFAIPRRQKQNERGAWCTSLYLQVVCVVIFVAFLGTCIGMGVVLSKDPEPWVSPPPTATPSAPSASPSTQTPTSAPTSFGWNRVNTIAKDDVESFGYQVDLSYNGSVLAVASPKYQGGRGRLDVFLDVGTEWQAIGGPVVGDLPDDKLGIGMHLSKDGSVVVVGSPGNNAGTVKVYKIDQNAGLSQMGQSITGPAPLSQFGYSVALNHDGSRLIVGAPLFGEDPNESYGMIRAYDFVSGSMWVQVGSDIFGDKNAGSRFGNSISTDDAGNRVLIGAPLDDNKVGEDAGRLFVFDLLGSTWQDYYSRSRLYGSKEGSQLGRKVMMSCDGNILASGEYGSSVGMLPNAGLLHTWTIYDKSTPSTPSLPVPYADAVPGTHEGERIGHDVDLDCYLRRYGVISSENRNRQAGWMYIKQRALSDGTWYDSGEFSGPELGDSVWLGKGPSVSISGYSLRFAVGYESIRVDGVSRAEVHIYDYIATP